MQAKFEGTNLVTSPKLAEKKPIVLVIDDELTIIKAIKMSLSSLDVEVHGVPSGQEGLVKVKELGPTVIVLDVLMHEMTGIQFLEILRPQPHDPHAVIVLTGNYNDQDLERCFDLGCSFFLRKPFSRAEICCHVKRCIEIKRRETIVLQQQKTMMAQLAASA